jgi:hypothetical protein
MADKARFEALGVMLLGLAGFAGFLFTLSPAMTPDDWPMWVAYRLVFQLGSTAWLAVLLARRGSRVREIVGVVAFGLLFSWSALRSVAAGPVEVEGIVVEYQVSSGGKGGLRVYFGVQDDHAVTTRISAMWGQGRHVIAQLGACARTDTRVRVTLLVPLGAMLAAECIEPRTVTELRRAREGTRSG